MQHQPVTNLLDRLAHRRARRAVQLAALAGVLVSTAVAFWTRSDVAAAISIAVSSLVALAALKLALVANVAVQAQTQKSGAAVAAREQQIDELRAQIEQLALQYERVRTLPQLVEPYVALLDLKEQEIDALREQAHPVA